MLNNNEEPRYGRLRHAIRQCRSEHQQTFLSIQIIIMKQCGVAAASFYSCSYPSRHQEREPDSPTRVNHFVFAFVLTTSLGEVTRSLALFFSLGCCVSEAGYTITIPVQIQIPKPIPTNSTLAIVISLYILGFSSSIAKHIIASSIHTKLPSLSDLATSQSVIPTTSHTSKPTVLPPSLHCNLQVWGLKYWVPTLGAHGKEGTSTTCTFSAASGQPLRRIRTTAPRTKSQHELHKFALFTAVGKTMVLGPRGVRAWKKERVRQRLGCTFPRRACAQNVHWTKDP
jgi:hypothetical protein